MFRYRDPKGRSMDRRRGAAMTETVLVLPVVLVILALLLLLGHSMMRLQGIAVMDRYEASRQVASVADEDALPPGQTELNDAFLRGEAETIDVQTDDYFPDAPRRRLRDTALQNSGEAGGLADRALEQFPHGRHVRSKTTFQSSIALEHRLGLAGPIHHGHVRLDNTWKFANGIRYNNEKRRWEPTGPRVSILPALSERYLSELNDRLPRGNDVAAAIRRLYLNEPAYEGPYLDLP